MGTITKDLGIATAYGYALSKGYTGTEEEFATLMASYATIAEEAAESASEAAESASAAGTSATSAAESATSASASATSAGTSATTATTKASEASASASTASTAATTASAKAGEASQSATNAAVSATAAGNAQTAAETAQGKAEDAQEAAEAAQAAAEEAAATLVLDDTLTQPNQAAESKAVGDALVNKAPVILTSASGSIANFPDGGEDLPVENLVISIEPKQSGSGDPSPDNVRPITGWDGCEVVRAGKNLFTGRNNEVTVPNGKLKYENGVITRTATAPVNITNLVSSLVIHDMGMDLTLMPGTYIFKVFDVTGDIQGLRPFLHLKCYDGSYVNQVYDSPFTLTQPATIEAIQTSTASFLTGDVAQLKPYIGIGTTASEYELPNSHTYPVSWVATSGTVYGGRVNVTTGELVVDRAMVDLGTLTWAKNDVTEGTLFRANVSDMVAGENRAWFICSAFPHVPIAQRANKTISQRLQNNVDIIDNDYSDAATFKTAMSGVQLVYELATPLTYQLTPVQVRTLLGVNNVWADCGDTEAEYRADTKLYIERLTQPSEDDMVANANIESGKYFMVGNTLYLSTQAVAAGEAIVAGTNCIATNLAEALNTLNA